MRRLVYVIPAQLLASIALRLRVSNGAGKSGSDQMDQTTNRMLAQMLDLLIQDQDSDEGEGMSSSRKKRSAAPSEDQQRIQDKVLADIMKKFRKLMLNPDTKRAAL